MKYFIALLIGILLPPNYNYLLAQEFVPIPELHERVTDQVGILTPKEKEILISKLESLEKDKGSQVAILIIQSTKPESIEEYSIRVVDSWKLGREKVDDGVLMLFAMTDRSMRIEVGYGLEGAIPDAIAKRIIDRIIVPEFRAKNFSTGIIQGADMIIDIIRNEKLPDTLQEEKLMRGLSTEDEMALTTVLGVFGLVFLVIGIGICLTSSLSLAIIMLILSFIITIFLGSVFSSIMNGLSFGLLVSGIISFFAGVQSGAGRGFSSGGIVYRSNSGWGGSGGGGFGRGGGGGGFSGGGGGFGGGGSSGSW